MRTTKPGVVADGNNKIRVGVKVGSYLARKGNLKTNGRGQVQAISQQVGLLKIATAK